MKKLKKYISSLKDLNENEKNTKTISYRRLINRISNNIFLLNNAPELADYDFEFICGSDYDEETEDYIEIYQYYLIDLCITEDELQGDLKALQNELIIAWSEKLQNYVLCVDHLGTSWDYVPTGVGYTTDFDKADL